MRRIATAILVALTLMVWEMDGTELFMALRAQQPAKLSRHAEKIRDMIKGLGTGNEVRVLVEMRDKTKIAGYVKRMELDGFELFDTVADTQRNVKYEDVKRIKALGSAWVQGKAAGQGQRRVVGKAALAAVVADKS